MVQRETFASQFLKVKNKKALNLFIIRNNHNSSGKGGILPQTLSCSPWNR